MSATARHPTAAEVELSMRLRQQELVAAFGIVALRGLDIAQIFDQVCIVAAQGLQTTFAKVLAFRPATQDFVLQSGVGWRDGVVGHATVGADLASPAGFAFRTKLPVVSNHLSAESRFRTPTVLADHGIHRAINVIIASDGAVPFGVLEVDSSDRSQFTAHDVAFLQSLANIIAASIDRQGQMQVQAALLREKDFLMLEVHHRVKNSLQLVQTMVHLQARSAPTDAERTRLEETASRIQSIAAIHEQLYKGGAVQNVALGPYLTELLTEIGVSLGGGIVPSITVEPMDLPAEHVTPIGLIAVELLTNALKYGAAPIEIAAVKVAGGVELMVRDAGAGFPATFDPHKTGSLGMRLISALARSPAPIEIDRRDDLACIRVTIAFRDTPTHG